MAKFREAHGKAGRPSWPSWPARLSRRLVRPGRPVRPGWKALSREAPCACLADNPLAVSKRMGYTVSRLAEVPPDGSREYRSALLVEACDKK